MIKWIKILDDILDIEDCQVQTTTDMKYTTTFIFIDLNKNPNYLDILHNYYTNHTEFDVDTKDYKLLKSIIKTFDLYQSQLTLNIRSEKLYIKDRMIEREERINELLDEDKTSDAKNNDNDKDGTK